MDLSFRLPDPAAESALPDVDMAMLIAMLADRQGTSVTAQTQALVDAGEAAPEAPLAPAHGSFNMAMAARLTGWKQP